MAKKTTTNKASETTNTEAVTLMDTNVYEVIAEATERGLTKGSVYKVSGVVAKALISKKLVKLK